MVGKANLTRDIASYRARAGRFDLVTVPPLAYLMVDGAGDPNTVPAYSEAVASLFPLAYALKFHQKRERGLDHVVMPLEGLWWAEDMAAFTSARDKDRWSWTLMILTPPWTTSEDVDAARGTVSAKGGAPRLPDVRWETLDEGPCVQTLHVGPYDAEGPVLARMHDEVIAGRGLRPTGRHHEVYLSDARRTAPERLRTILRQPVGAAASGPGEVSGP